MFGFFLDKKNIFSFSFLFLSFVFGYLYLNFFLEIGLLTFFTIGIIATLHLVYINFYATYSNSFYRDFIFCLGVLISLNHDLTTRELSIIFSFGILWFIIAKENFKNLEFHYSIGLFTGFSIISDWFFSVIVLGVFFLVNFRVFSFVRFTNFILGILTAFCLFWLLLFLLGKPQIFTEFFPFRFFSLETLKIDLSIFMFKAIYFLPILLIILYIMNYFIERQFLFSNIEIKRINFMLSLTLAVTIGVLFSGKYQYFLFLLNLPVSYLIGSYLSYVKTEKYDSLIKESVLATITISYLLYFIFENNLL